MSSMRRINHFLESGLGLLSVLSFCLAGTAAGQTESYEILWGPKREASALRPAVGSEPGA